MTATESHLIKTYLALFSGLSNAGKIELIEGLSASLEETELDKDAAFFKTFGAFIPEKSAEDIIAEIKANRKFKRKDLSF